MRRFRLSTLLLLVAIAALSIALVVQHDRAARREAELQARIRDHLKAQFAGLNILPDYMKQQTKLR
jgi:hypothetical protein